MNIIQGRCPTARQLRDHRGRTSPSTLLCAHLPIEEKEANPAVTSDTLRSAH
ncbi:hypothetical protein BofuT4_P143940.1 [Botrytis cinerea T4]|uniref:Uncharacterized protein n=1 Tax=Botryotinia fuckeliana (strain T4) TaxID=999810 RepID=G2YY88_BOTF4|nr:hypothetical protein BofuT4_P143940.1 [Botrytis cinerea T4]